MTELPPGFSFDQIEMTDSLLVDEIGAACSKGPLPGLGVHVIGMVATGRPNAWAVGEATVVLALQIPQAASIIVALQWAARQEGLGDRLADEVVRITKHFNDMERARGRGQ